MDKTGIAVLTDDGEICFGRDDNALLSCISVKRKTINAVANNNYYRDDQNRWAIVASVKVSIATRAGLKPNTFLENPDGNGLENAPGVPAGRLNRRRAAGVESSPRNDNVFRRSTPPAPPSRPSSARQNVHRDERPNWPARGHGTNTAVRVEMDASHGLPCPTGTRSFPVAEPTRSRRNKIVRVELRTARKRTTAA